MVPAQTAHRLDESLLLHILRPKTNEEANMHDDQKTKPRRTNGTEVMKKNGLLFALDWKGKVSVSQHFTPAQMAVCRLNNEKPPYFWHELYLHTYSGPKLTKADLVPSIEALSPDELRAIKI